MGITELAVEDRQNFDFEILLFPLTIHSNSRLPGYADFPM
jgi:hypothetical protein